MSAQQKKHPFDFKTQYGLGFNTQDDEIVVDFFCGGGGAGTGLEMGLGRAVNVAKNHSPQAISMHTVNHPGAVHYTTDVFDGDPDTEGGGKAVGWFHMSPDCTHHSQAAGGQPRKREIRNLSWIGLKWAGKKKPRVISLENVKQILQWGPLIAKRCKATGRVVTLDLVPHPTKPKSMVNRIAAQGEVVPVDNQFLVPDPSRRGQTWAVFVAELERLGYDVEWRVIKACDFGAPTSRERLFMIARCDGQPIVWPEPTHAKNPVKGQKKWRTAAECIDWTVPSKSIFGRPKPLADATLRRIAKGMKKFVIDAADPFIVPIANWSGESVQSAHEPLRTVTSWPRGGSFAIASPIIAPATHQGSDRINDPHAPLPTVTCANRGELTLISPVLVGAGGPEYSGKPTSIDQPSGTLMTQNHRVIAAAHLVKFRFADEGKALDEPLPTITSGGNYQRPAGAAHAMGISSVFMAQMNGGFNTTAAKSIEDPLTTVTNTGSQQQLVTANLVHLRGNCDARDVADPLHTISAGGTHHGLVTAFMERQFGASVGQGMDEPAPTITAGGGGKSSLVEFQLAPEVEAGALRVAAFLISYYGTENMSAADAPAPTITTKDRLGLVTVTIKGTPYVIVDICLRMLQPAELYKAQGFPADYIISHGADGKPFTKTQQVHMCGNSVSPPPMAALARANDPWRVEQRQAVAA
ncbi:DNA cytosine methyltransferase [Pseudomonas sp. SWRI74]|uniref:DNA cytosine methyltransferase n=1 Tax=Pseudomonas azerbaijanoccidentalis TaxID=2842347 RepID=A0ABS6QHW0_9PSED|nr:DNA cytosine methyltransferase [Pseudomonas azerbaijanoccidentalis]MBV4518488.1 DNA cytosine methyltransferase [Pseudomonas azerbaijanoccidentalis]